MPPQEATVEPNLNESRPLGLSVYQGRLNRQQELERQQQRDAQNGDKQNEENDKGEGTSESTLPWYKRPWRRWANFYAANSFLVGVVVAILLARAYPPLGAEYLQPQITATWIAVIFIFIMAGLGLKTEELRKAFTRVWFNGFVQIFNFGVVSATVFGFSRLMDYAGAIDRSLADGMVICSCLPLTVNMVLVLTKSSGGDEASAIFNAAFGNLVGVFLSPVLILGYIGVSGNVDLVTVFYKLALRVLAPILVGQILQKTSKTVVAFVKKYKKHFKKAQEWALIFIVYTVFCKSFADGPSSSVGDVFLMILFQGILLVTTMIMAWMCLKFLFRNQPKLRVMGLFGCTHKTVAMGVPLINAIYENDSNVGLYTLPLLIWHPMQLVIGSALAPRLAAFVKREEERLGIPQEANEKEPEEEPQKQSQGESAEIPQGNEEPKSTVANEKGQEVELSVLHEEQEENHGVDEESGLEKSTPKT